jgi:hypothetical protein
MRVAAVAALFTLIPVLAPAQHRTSTLPPIGLPLPEIGLPLPPLGLAPPSGPTPVERAVGGGPRRGRTGPHGGRSGRGRSGGGVIYFVPAYPWIDGLGALTPGAIAAPPAETPAAPAVPATGTLWLELAPTTPSQVFVDGEFVGSVDDHRNGLVLAAGTHQVELRERGSEPLRFDVRIEAGRAITYRGRPQPAPSAPRADPPATPPIERKPFYYIEGCYLGDVPPAAAKLPASCDPAKATIFWP